MFAPQVWELALAGEVIVVVVDDAFTVISTVVDWLCEYSPAVGTNLAKTL